MKRLKSPIVKRSIVIDGHKTSVSLEPVFWTDLKMLAESREVTLSTLVAQIDADRKHANLSSAIRTFLYTKLQEANGELHAAAQTIVAAAKDDLRRMPQ